jgi:hypothetical protein
MASLLPASRIEVFDVTVPKGTPKAAPIETQTRFTPGELVGIEVKIPDGHNGLTGFRILLAGGQAIPATAGAWVSGNDDELDWNTIGYPSSGAWSMQAYNTDAFDHVFHVRYLVSDFVYNQPAATPAVVATPLAV